MSKEKIPLQHFKQVAPNQPRRAKMVVLVALTLLVLASPSWAVPTIDFLVTPSPDNAGVVAYDGSGGPMLGVNIGVNFVIGTSTPGPGIDGFPYACIDCFLNFQTGNLLAAPPNAWVFDSANSGIAITGSVDINDDGVGDIGGGTNLLAGVFAGPTVTVDFLPNEVGAIGLTTAAILDFKNPLLAAFYGLPAFFAFDGDMTLIWAGVGESPSPFAGQVLSGFVRNEGVPEPGTLLLLGFGLAGLLRSRRAKS